MLNTPTAPRRQTLEILTTRMSIRVEDQKGQLRCDAAGFPAGLDAQQAFVTSAPIHATGIWLVGCNGISVKSCEPLSRIHGITAGGHPHSI